MAVPTIAQPSGQVLHLGRIRPLAAYDYGPFHVVITSNGKKVMPRLGAFYNSGADNAPPPDAVDWFPKALPSISQMYGNDQQGDCVIASAMHQVGIWTGNDTDSGGCAVGTTQEALSQYHVICGAGDNGCNITDVLDATKAGRIKVGGKVHRIDDYVAVDWTNKMMVKVAIDVFGTIKTGVNLPSAWGGGNDGDTWDVTSSRIVGGHDIPAGAYNDQGVTIATWAGVRLVTWPAFQSRKWFEEAYAVLSPDWYNQDNLAPNGINVAGLRAALEAIRNGQVPDVPTPPGAIIDWMA